MMNVQEKMSWMRWYLRNGWGPDPRSWEALQAEKRLEGGGVGM